MVYGTGERRHGTTRASPDSDGHCPTVIRNPDVALSVSGERRFAMRATPVSPAHVTSAFSLPKLL